MRRQTLPIHQRAALCSHRVTLNGERAVVSGYCHDFATITQIRTGLSVQWAWETVARVVASGGNFTS